jgi:hypothetical protein
LPRQARDKQNKRFLLHVSLLLVFSLAQGAARVAAVAMGGLRLALEKLRRPSRPHQQAEV